MPKTMEEWICEYMYYCRSRKLIQAGECNGSEHGVKDLDCVVIIKKQIESPRLMK